MRRVKGKQKTPTEPKANAKGAVKAKAMRGSKQPRDESLESALAAAMESAHSGRVESFCLRALGTQSN